MGMVVGTKARIRQLTQASQSPQLVSPASTTPPRNPKGCVGSADIRGANPPLLIRRSAGYARFRSRLP